MKDGEGATDVFANERNVHSKIECKSIDSNHA